jgi:hypothetical protein
MNADLITIVKRIIAEQGESVLADPARLKPLIKDYAQNVPQDERRAFGRCIESGFYRLIKAAQTTAERRRLKADLARHLQGTAGMSAALCSGALDVLDAAVPLSGAQTAQGTGRMVQRISRKTLIFAIAGAIGGFAGELISEIIRIEGEGTFWGNVYITAIWIALCGLSISIALLTAQSIYLKKKPVVKTLIKTALFGTLLGAVAGGAAQIIFAFTQNISILAEIISRIICWGIAGWGVGWGVSTFVPNFPKKRAMAAGFLGGFIGGAVFRASFSLLSEGAGRSIGIAILGFFIGLTISLVEEALREAWLTVIWGPKETANISLGSKPVVFGSTPEADVYLPQRRGDAKPLPVRAVVSIENGQVILEDKVTNQRGVLQNGSEITIERLRVVVNTKR